MHIHCVIGELIKGLFTKVWARLGKATNDGEVAGARNSQGPTCAVDVRPNQLRELPGEGSLLGAVGMQPTPVPPEDLTLTGREKGDPSGSWQCFPLVRCNQKPQGKCLLFTPQMSLQDPERGQEEWKGAPGGHPLRDVGQNILGWMLMGVGVGT